MASSAISNVLAVFQSAPSEIPSPVRFIPAPYLFTHAESLPEGMQAAEIAGFAEVTLEGLAPVPMEQLAWGFMADEKSKHVFIFAALRDRLTQENLAPEESFYHVLPSFFAAAPAGGAAHWVFLWEANHLTAIHYGAGETVPSHIEIELLAEDTAAGAFAARERLLKRLGGTGKVEAVANVLARPDAVRAARDRLSFWFANYTAAEVEPVRVAGTAPAQVSTRWSADLRGNLFRETEQTRRRAAVQSTRILQVGGVCAVLLLLLQVGWAGGKIWLGRSNARYTAQTPDVNLIQQKIGLLTQIEKFTDHQLHPFEMLGVINPLRPKNVIYKNAKAFENNKLVADCDATDASLMNSFTDQLKNSGLVAVDPNAHAVSVGLGHVRFRLSLTFNKVPPPEAMPAPPPPPAPETPPQMEQPEAPPDLAWAGASGTRLSRAEETAAAAAAQNAQAIPAPTNGPTGPAQPPPDQPAAPAGPNVYYSN